MHLAVCSCLVPSLLNLRICIWKNYSAQYRVNAAVAVTYTPSEVKHHRHMRLRHLLSCLPLVLCWALGAVRSVELCHVVVVVVGIPWKAFDDSEQTRCFCVSVRARITLKSYREEGGPGVIPAPLFAGGRGNSG